MARNQTHDWDSLVEAAKRAEKKDEHRHILSKFRELRTLTKYGIVALAGYFTLHSALMMAGIDHFVLHLIGVAFMLVMGWKLSSLFELCFLHRMCIIYLTLTAALLLHDSYEGSGYIIQGLRHGLIACGANLMILLWLRHK